MALFNNLQSEERLLIKIINDYIHQQSTTIEDNIDWNRMGYLLQKHQLSAIAYYQCKNLVGSAILKGAYYSTVAASSEIYRSGAA